MANILLFRVHYVLCNDHIRRLDILVLTVRTVPFLKGLLGNLLKLNCLWDK